MAGTPFERLLVHIPCPGDAQLAILRTPYR